MMTDEHTAAAAAVYARLLAEEKACQSPPVAKRPTRLPVDSITQEPALFQPRNAELDEQHVRELVRAIGSQGPLDPVLVIQVGGSTAQVGNMRKVLAKLGEVAWQHESWREAMDAARGVEGRAWSDEEREELQRRKAEDMAMKLRRAWGPPRDQPEITALALELYLGRRMTNLVDWLAPHNDTEGEF